MSSARQFEQEGHRSRHKQSRWYIIGMACTLRSWSKAQSSEKRDPVFFRTLAAQRKRGRRIFNEHETGERRELVLPRLERVAPELVLPPVEIDRRMEGGVTQLRAKVTILNAPNVAPKDVAIEKSASGFLRQVRDVVEKRTGLMANIGTEDRTLTESAKTCLRQGTPLTNFFREVHDGC